MKNKGLLIVVSGASGTGKGTICKALIEKNPSVHLSISATTRKPRGDEKDGVNYHFKSEDDFKEMIDNNEFLEWAVFCNNYYGTPVQCVQDLLEQGKNVILEIEVQGAIKVRSKFPEGVYIFILPPSMEELRLRIMNRATESKFAIEERLNTAKSEFNNIYKYNYIVVNDTVDNAVNQIEAIITAETCRVERSQQIIKEVCGE